MITNVELTEYELDHRHGGMGWVMVQDIDSEFCRIAATGGSVTKRVGRQAFLAAKSLLTVSLKREDPKEKDSPMVACRIPEDILPDLAEVRRGIKSGKIVIKDSHMIFK